MKNKPITVFLIDDEFPKPDHLRRQGVFNRGITTEVLYRLAVDEEWNSNLIYLQQLIKDVVSSDACNEGHIELVGFSSPTQALVAIDQGLSPVAIIYDWEYPNAPITNSNSKDWLLDILRKTDAFVFVYSKMRDELPRFLNTHEFIEYTNRFQLFLKGGKVKLSFSAEEFILQFIIGASSRSGQIKINGIEIEFTSNNYLKSASDILYLQRILGSQYVLDELPKLNFSVDEASVEKILNDSEKFLFLNEEKKILISPRETTIVEKLSPCVKISFLEVVKRYSIQTLEDAIERGVLPI